MAFKTITDLSADVTISLGGINKKTGKANPTTVEGYYLGSKEVEDRKKKSGVSYLYILQTSKGNVAVWGKTDLDRKMKLVTPGSMVRVTQSGKQATANGDMYKFKVEVDEENSIEVTSEASTSSNSYESEEPSFDDSDSFDDSPSYEEEEKTQQVALSAAERAAKVKALLAKKK